MHYCKDEIKFEAQCNIIGVKNRLIFELTGKALSTFKSNRIGFCILHPIEECINKPCRIIHPDGSSEVDYFPQYIAAHQPMLKIRAMHWRLNDNIQAKLKFSGEVFEMEDQRNWSDASYKSYCRPLELPFPFIVETGQQINQKIEFELIAPLPPATEKNEFISFKIIQDRSYPLPAIGVEATSRREPLEEIDATILKQLPLSHIRAELNLDDSSWFQQQFKRYQSLEQA